MKGEKDLGSMQQRTTSLHQNYDKLNETIKAQEKDAQTLQ
jgi:hypothetical protein